ncbi:MAG: hypothetical protein ABL859_04355, partial [Methylotenera sp.]
GLFLPCACALGSRFLVKTVGHFYTTKLEFQALPGALMASFVHSSWSLSQERDQLAYCPHKTELTVFFHKAGVLKPALKPYF